MLVIKLPIVRAFSAESLQMFDLQIKIALDFSYKIKSKDVGLT